MTHKQIVEIAYRWVLKNGSCGVAFKELSFAGWGEIPDVMGFGNGHSLLIECKVSRSDFLADANKPFRKNPQFGMGKHRYYCTPANLIKISELPEGWGLIEVNEKGKARKVHIPKMSNPNYPEHQMHYYHNRNIEAELAMMYSALRRLQLRGRIEEIYEPLYNEKTTMAQEIQNHSNNLFN